MTVHRLLDQRDDIHHLCTAANSGAPSGPQATVISADGCRSISAASAPVRQHGVAQPVCGDEEIFNMGRRLPANIKF